MNLIIGDKQVAELVMDMNKAQRLRLVFPMYQAENGSEDQSFSYISPAQESELVLCESNRDSSKPARVPKRARQGNHE